MSYGQLQCSAAVVVTYDATWLVVVDLVLPVVAAVGAPASTRSIFRF
jgi:hypothetical protein